MVLSNVYVFLALKSTSLFRLVRYFDQRNHKESLMGLALADTCHLVNIRLEHLVWLLGQSTLNQRFSDEDEDIDSSALTDLDYAYKRYYTISLMYIHCCGTRLFF